MPVEIIDAKKKNQVELLLIVKRTRAKGEDDENLARIYEPGEEIRIKGSGKLSLLALGKATRNLDYDISEAENSRKKPAKSKSKVETEKAVATPVPKLSNMKLDELDLYADTSLGLNTKVFKTKAEKIAAIKAALKS